MPYAIQSKTCVTREGKNEARKQKEDSIVSAVKMIRSESCAVFIS